MGPVLGGRKEITQLASKSDREVDHIFLRRFSIEVYDCETGHYKQPESYSTSRFQKYEWLFFSLADLFLSIVNN